MEHNFRKWCLKPGSMLLAAVLLCGIAGCSKNEGEISQTESSEESFMTTEELIKDFNDNYTPFSELCTH